MVTQDLQRRSTATNDKNPSGLVCGVRPIAAQPRPEGFANAIAASRASAAAPAQALLLRLTIYIGVLPDFTVHRDQRARFNSCGRDNDLVGWIFMKSPWEGG
jgi:hypothetical protein